MRVYLDNCCFNRPFDDQRQMRIRLEAEGKLHIQEYIRQGTLELVWSYMLDFENAATPFQERRVTIYGWRQYAMMDIEESEQIVKDAHALTRMGLKAKDALHLACAKAANCIYFVTTDDGILKHRDAINDITVIDPTAFIRERNL